MISGRLKLACVVGFLIVWSLYYSSKQTPLDPILKISQSRPTPITQNLVDNVKVWIDGKDIVVGQVIVQSGASIAITGECQERTLEHPMGMIVIGYRRSGTPESLWEQHDHSQEWMFPKSQRFAFSGDHRVNVEPGEYDLRVYVASISIRTNMPVMEHVMNGHMKVIAKRYERPHLNEK